MLKSGLFITAGNIVSALFALIRNLLFARLISVEDFGIATTFAITAALIEMTSNIAIDRLIVQAKDGENPKLQSTLQSVQLLRGLLGGLILLLFADVIAFLFGLPETAWAYRLLALFPVIRGLLHLDMFRLQRDMKFGPFVFAELCSIGFSTACAIPLALWLNDFRAMLYAILIHQTLFLILSHIIAQRKYQLSWDYAIVKRSLAFGWPLLLNGALIFGIFQGDRIIVANQLGMADLGLFSVAFMLTLTPSLVLGKTLNSYFLPQISKNRDDISASQSVSLAAIEAGIFAGILLAGFFAIFGPFLMVFLFGEKYNTNLDILVWLAIMQGIRIAKEGPFTSAVANADTKNPLFANIARIAVLPFSFFVVAQTQNLLLVVLIAALGEILALFVSLTLLCLQGAVRWQGLVLPTAAGFVFFAAVASNLLIWPNNEIGVRFDELCVTVLLFAFALCAMPALRMWFKQILK